MPTHENSGIYASSYPVVSRSEAEVLSREVVWDILAHLRKRGAGGATADEIARELKVSRSTVYSTLKELRRFNFLGVYSQKDGHRKTRRKVYACRAGTWGWTHVDEHFAAAMRISGGLKEINQELDPLLIRALANFYDDFSTKRELSSLIPKVNPNNICPTCKRNHEAIEFFTTVCVLAIHSLISESKEFEEFLVERKFSSGSFDTGHV